MPDASPSPMAPKPGEHATVKDTLVSLIIAFAMAFVFRGFVAEAFVIPTGSMAPTLLGAHMDLRSPSSGYTWPVNPWRFVNNDPQSPYPSQGTSGEPIVVHDPMSRGEIRAADLPTHSGDRIFVLKYLYSINDPLRFDAIVFKAPHEPQTNYIKRLLGLPGEQIALVDGDLFVRAPRPDDPDDDDADTWSLDGWSIARKPRRVQDSVWQPVFDSSYAPEAAAGRSFRGPWVGVNAEGKPDSGWDLTAGRVYTHAGGSTALAWSEPADVAARDWNSWTLTDRNAYNEVHVGGLGSMANRKCYPVSDVRASLGVEPKTGELASIAAVLDARGMEFRAEIQGTNAAVRMRALGEGDEPHGPWTTLAERTLRHPIRAGRVTNVVFTHADQALRLEVDGVEVARAEYNWSPALRIQHAMGRSVPELLSIQDQTRTNPFANPGNYRRPAFRWEFASPSGLTLHRVSMARDLHYRADMLPPHLGDAPARATHPRSSVVLEEKQYFACGDNSPASSDGRLWDPPDPWVSREIDATAGIVPRDLLIGKAFFVYFPSLHKERPFPVPDFGRMRFIW